MENLPATQAPSSLIALALDKGADASTLEKLEKVLELQERWEANEARKAYHEAMAKFKTNPPEIEKDKKVSYQAGGGKTEYWHATLANVTSNINKALSQYGLSASWNTKQDNGTITVTCKITHSLGHSEQTSLTASPDTSGSKNPIQAIGSTVAYLERYTILALTGLATKDMDDDGNAAGVEYISEKQLSSIIDMINDREADEKKFCEFMGVESVERIPATDFNKAMAALKSKKKKETGEQVEAI
jgi:hypothetical protein